MSSNDRLATIIFKLLNGEEIAIPKLADDYKTTIRTIQRDIQVIKLTGSQFGYSLLFDNHTKKYHLVSSSQLDKQKLHVILKILLESRAFNTDETENLVTSLLQLVAEEDALELKKSIKNELTFYHSLRHKKPLLDKIAKVDNLIQQKKIITINYKKNRGQLIDRQVLPVSIFFSEYYFYAICFELDKKRYINLRIDRIQKIESLDTVFKIPHQYKLEESQLREKTYFMYSGKETTFSFRFWGIIEAALDKLPNAKVIKPYDDQSVIIQATAQDTGVIMWLLSQGKNVQVLEPVSFVDKIKNEIEQMKMRYD